MTLRLRSVARAALLLAVEFAPVGADAASVTATNAMKKIRAGDPVVASGVTSINIEAARNEFESFQIVVRGPATQVTAKATNFISGPNVLSAAACDVPGNIRLYREAFLNIDTRLGQLTSSSTCSVAPNPPPLSDGNGTGGLVPDGLIPQVDEFDNKCRNFMFDMVPSGQNGIIWVDVFVPPTAAAGTYQGQIDVSWTDASVSCGVSQQAISVNLTVFDFTLDSRSHLRSHFGSVSSQAGLKQQHGLPLGGALTTLLGRYATLALDHRISMTGFDDGQSFAPPAFPSTYNSAFGPVINGTAPGLRLQSSSTDHPKGVTSIMFVGNKTDSSLYGTWISNMNAQGWFDRFFTYTVDEPGHVDSWCDIGPRGAAAHSAVGGALLPTLVTKDFQPLAATAIPAQNTNCSIPPPPSYTIDPVLELIPFCGVFPAVGGGFPDAQTKATLPGRVPRADDRPRPRRTERA